MLKKHLFIAFLCLKNTFQRVFRLVADKKIQLEKVSYNFDSVKIS